MKSFNTVCVVLLLFLFGCNAGRATLDYNTGTAIRRGFGVSNGRMGWIARIFELW